MVAKEATPSSSLITPSRCEVGLTGSILDFERVVGMVLVTFTLRIRGKGKDEIQRQRRVLSSPVDVYYFEARFELYVKLCFEFVL